MEQYLIDEIIYSYIIVYIAYINDELISSLNYRKKYPPLPKKKNHTWDFKEACVLGQL